MTTPRQVHGSCASRDGEAVLVTGPPGSGKSDLVLRLIGRGFSLVADDRVDIDADGVARPPPALAGLLEVRCLGIFRLPFVAEAKLALAVQLAPAADRLPFPARHESLDIPLIRLDAAAPSAAERVALALDCAMGRVSQIAGSFAI
jgi:HPr kinase/phosphorylase